MEANQVRGTGRMALVALLAAVLAALGGPALVPVPTRVTSAGVVSASASKGGEPVDALATTRAAEPMLARPLGLSAFGVVPSGASGVDLVLAGAEPVANVATAGAARLGTAGARAPPLTF